MFSPFARWGGRPPRRGRWPRHFDSALHVARCLEQHPAVERVSYPFLPSHPQHSLAKRQMRGGAGLFSVRLKTRAVADVRLFIDSLRLFRRAVSWGGYESLIFPEAARYTSAPPPERVSVIRLHIGLEDKDSLLGELVGALDRL